MLGLSLSILPSPDIDIVVFLLVVSHQQCYLLWDPSRLPLPSKPTKFETDQTNSQRRTSPNGERAGAAITHHDREAHGLYSTRYRREAGLWKSPHGSNAGVRGQIPGTLLPAWRRQEAAGCCTVQDLLLQGGSAAALGWGWRLGWVPPGWKSGRERYESLLSSICKSVLFKPLLMQGKTAF